MARSRRSSTSTSSRKSAPTSSKAPAPAKQPSASVPATASAPAPRSGGGLMSTIADGFAFGTGSSIARHGVDAVANAFGGSKDEAAQPAAEAPTPASAAKTTNAAAMCASDNKAFLECLDRNTHDVSACQFYLDALNQCKQHSANM
ncbi:hypothetical protein BBJ28_00020346 [Nothophytophthora sp. Chile5]|nr:hypothetical protein BBJ28_00020346 [Nothophytophthora sp. Chile5]